MIHPVKILTHAMWLLVIASCASPAHLNVSLKSFNISKGSGAEAIKRGQEIFTAKCARCHEQVIPEEGSSENWHTRYPAMAWDAELSRADANAVIEYLRAAR
jgi:mono/diheme cytochrome c family protein